MTTARVLSADATTTHQPTPQTSGRAGTMSLLASEIVWSTKIFLRNPIGVLFALVLPMFFLVLFNVLTDRGELYDGLPFVQWNLAGITVFVVASSCFINLAIATVFSREAGTLRRMRSTPLPPGVYVLSRVLTNSLVALFSTLLMVFVAWAVFGLQLKPLPAIAGLLALLVGVLAYSALGMAVANIVPTQETSIPIVMFLSFPLLFAAGVFFPLEGAPQALITAMDLMPVRPFGMALQQALDPATSGLAIAWQELGVLAAWGLLGTFLASRFFRWEPRGSG
ncbi:ABC transporter permease [Ornithinimicrobium pratense]|uniref:Transport permease protein n=1 Tax=Ornithinimicrobium pratense TaxID=2593973 RepID=A0A5J6V614_9MICO|nr:ABC transporter permease [Ornithinimicrobium pratense]QFG69440.1 ABC transporter permease [Ornithinimicrobium pratense]